ncbi:hypothetical protein FOZ63_016656, partial [Perkinsus olseni]
EVMVAATALEDVVMMITLEGEAIEMSMAEMTVEALEGVQGATAAIDVREVGREVMVVAAGIVMTITEAVVAEDTENVIIMVAGEEAGEEAEVGVEAMIVTIGNGEAGSIGPEGKVYPGVMIPGGSNGGVPDSFPGALANTPHPAFRFARPVTDVHVRVLDVTHPDRAMIKWDAKFRLGPPLGEESAPAETPAEEGLGSGDGIEGGSNELPGDLKPIGGELPVFQKFCSKLNRPHMYKVTVNAGGGHPLDETLRMKAGIYRVIMLGPTPHGCMHGSNCAHAAQSPPGTSYAQTSSFAGKGGGGGMCGDKVDPPAAETPCFHPPSVTIHKAEEYMGFL